jgi:hypothetical protein
MKEGNILENNRLYVNQAYISIYCYVNVGPINVLNFLMYHFVIDIYVFETNLREVNHVNVANLLEGK